MVLQEKVEGNRRNENHQQNDDPIQRMLEKLEVDDLVHDEPALASLHLLALLKDLGNGSQDGEAQGHHEQHRDPIGGCPTDDRL